MRISDWSSDVCSSELLSPAFRREGRGQTSRAATRGRGSAARAAEDAAQQTERYSRDLAGLQAAALNLQTRLADTAEARFRLESQALDNRSEARRGGKECVSACRSRWAPVH